MTDGTYQLLPRLSDDEIARLIPSTRGRDVEVPVVVDEDHLTIGTNLGGVVLAAFLQPAIGGGWFVTTIENGTGVGTFARRPIAKELLPAALDYLGWKEDGAKWRTEPTEATRFAFLDIEPNASTATKTEGGQARNDVYFVQSAGGGPIKIGNSGRPEDRLAAMQSHCPFPLKILATTKGGSRAEHALHERFAHLRSHGEWFWPGDDLIRFIEAEGIPWTTS